MESVGEGEGGKNWENGIETCKISCMKKKKEEDCSPESGPGLPVPAPGSERPASRPVISTFLLCTRYPVYVCVFSPVRLGNPVDCSPPGASVTGFSR